MKFKELAVRAWPGPRIPAASASRRCRTSDFNQRLRQNALFDDWLLETLVPDTGGIFCILQERWLIFLDRDAGKGASIVREDEKPYGLAIEGPVDQPFDRHPAGSTSTSATPTKITVSWT